MTTTGHHIEVWADWAELPARRRVGELTVQVTRGKEVYDLYCGSVASCHKAGGPSVLQPQEIDGLAYVPLEGLSEELLRAVTRKGLGAMAAGLSEQDIPEPDLAALVEYMLALGRGQNP